VVHLVGFTIETWESISSFKRNLKEYSYCGALSYKLSSVKCWYEQSTVIYTVTQYEWNDPKQYEYFVPKRKGRMLSHRTSLIVDMWSHFRRHSLHILHIVQRYVQTEHCTEKYCLMGKTCRCFLFDFGKTRDTMCPYSVLRILHRCNLRNRQPLFVSVVIQDLPIMSCLLQNVML